MKEDPEGTWYVRSGGDLYAVWPDGTTHLVPEDEPEPSPLSDEGILPPGQTEHRDRARDVATADV